MKFIRNVSIEVPIKYTHFLCIKTDANLFVVNFRANQSSKLEKHFRFDRQKENLLPAWEELKITRV